MADEIRRGGGNEVFFLGTVFDGQVVEAAVLARGNVDSVPAILHVPRPGQVVIHNHPSGHLTPSPPDVDIASHLGNSSVGFYIVNNDVSEVYPVVPVFAPKPALKPASADLADALRPGGALTGTLPDVEDRPGQHAMLGAVARAFNRDEIAVLEAGTGTGKTFAYLLPSLDWAIKNRKRVLVATHTITLQEQVMQKDVPALRAVFGDEFRAVLVKGRSNYISLRRVRELEESVGTLIDDPEQGDAQSLIRWALQTQDGSRSDLPFQVRPDLWERVQSETDNCLRARCPTYSQCHFFRARREALEADLLVANHHLLFADLAVRAELENDDAGLLPRYDRIILDEAHHAEEVATNYFGRQVSRYGARRALYRVWRDSGRGAKGVLQTLKERIALQSRRLPEGIAPAWIALLESEVLPARLNLEYAMNELFDQVHMLARAGLSEQSSDARTLRIDHELMQSEGFLAIQGIAKDALRELVELLRRGRNFLRKVDPYGEDIGILGYIAEFESSLNRLEAYGDAIEAVLLQDSREHVRWFETRSADPRYVTLQTAPIDVGELMVENLFEKHRSVVMTSATLAVAGDMKFLRSRTGLDRVRPESRIQEAQFPSPFDFEKQSRFYVVDDLPSPDDPTYESKLEDVLPRLLLASDGRAFVLFTSFRSLQRQYRAAERLLSQAGIRCLKQGEAPRHKLLETFREDTRSVLFGTDSFWEGVDVEGEALSTVILTRLPFRVPTHPVLVARCEAIDAAGGRAFSDYTVPMAVVKFRQGFGRLIRRRSDRGVVVVTDKRVVSRPYGKKFLRSLPDMPVEAAPAQEVETSVRRFFTT